MKNPNGYGTITKLSGNRRRPYIIKEGQSGHQHPIGYTATREEALILLAMYNRQPWNLVTARTTFRALYELWLDKKAYRMKPSTRNALRSAYRHCKTLDEKEYRAIRTWEMQDCIDACGLGYATQATIKNLFRHLDRFAMELDIIDKSRATLLTSDIIPATKKTVFSDAEIRVVKEHADRPMAECALFLLYTGFRISEMLALTRDSVSADAQTVTGGMKTSAGRGRVIPIHPYIKPMVDAHLASSVSGHLFEYRGKPYSQTQFRRLWRECMAELGMTHTPHECRHTFRSRLDSAGANKVCIDRLMGHVSSGTGERVYTHKTLQELRETILLITD